MHSSGFFWIKPIARLILKCEILGSHTISDQSLLLSTIVLNDSLPVQSAGGEMVVAEATVKGNGGKLLSSVH